MSIKIRTATMKDFGALYKIGLGIPELKVNNDEPFMNTSEFKWSIKNPSGIFLVAEDRKTPVGFFYANTKSSDTRRPNGVACFVYIAIPKKYRHMGVAQMLHSEAYRRLKQRGVNYIYLWANAKDKTAIRFAGKQGFKKGNAFFWMSRKLKP